MADASILKFVGVDLSASSIVVASSTKEEPAVVAVAVNDVSNRATPATVGFDGNLRLVGDAAEAKLSQLPKQTVTYLPAMLGGAEAARANYERLGCMWHLAEEGGQVGPMSWGGREEVLLQPASCLAALLRKLVGYATDDLPAPVAASSEPADAAVEGQQEPPAKVPQSFELVAAVPDSWTQAELGSLRAALDILGWEVPKVQALPYSAALATAYAQRIGQKLAQDEAKRLVLFADMGATQSMVSLVAFAPRPAPAEGEEAANELSVEVLAKAVAPGFGTHSLYASLLEHVNKTTGAKGQEPTKMASKRGLRLVAALQKVVKELSMLPEATLALECFFPDESDLKMDLTQALFEDIVGPQMQKFEALVKSVLVDSAIPADEVHSVEMVGGGMRIPRAKQILSQLFPDKEGEADGADGSSAAEMAGKGLSKRLKVSMDGASAIATGAAHYAAGRRAMKEVAWDLAAQESSLDEQALQASRELEAWMASTNEEEERRLEKGNELESYIYAVRSWLSGADRGLLQPEKVEPLLDETFNWFEEAQYDEGTTRTMYEERLGGLKRQLEEHGSEYFEKKRREQEEKDKFLDEEAEKERQRRTEAGMDADKDDRRMAKSDRLKMAAKNKDEGNTVFKAGNLEDAAARYQRALQHLTKFFMLDVSPDEKAEADAVSLSVHLNLAQVYLKMATQTEKDAGKEKAEAVYLKAKNSAEEALKIDADNVKARFRKATAAEKLGDLDLAQKEVKSALKTDPENADLTKLKERLEKLQAQQTAKAKKMYGKMFG